MEHLKEKDSLQIYEAWSNIRYKYRNREFWYKGYLWIPWAKMRLPDRLYAVQVSSVGPVTEDPRVLRGDLF